MKVMRAIALVLVALLPLHSIADNRIRVSAPITQAAAAQPPVVPEEPEVIPEPEPEPEPLVGVPPSMDGLQVLYRFNGAVFKEGAWGGSMAIKNGGVVAADDSPFADGSKSTKFSGNGLYSSIGPISGTGNFSLGIWVRTTTATGYLISQRDAQNDGQYVLQLSGGAVCYWDFPKGIGTGAMCSNKPVNDGEWHHIGFSRSGRVLSIYVDGVMTNTVTPGSINPVLTTNGLAIAFDQRDNGRYTAMNARDVFVYSRALSAEEFLWLGVNKLPFP